MDRGALLEQYWEHTVAQNAKAMEQYFHPEAVIRWHNTNEQFTVAEFIRANCAYPSCWCGKVERVAVLGDTCVTVVRVWEKNTGTSFHATSFFAWKEGKIVSLDEYWGDDGAPPVWRREMHLGKPIT